MKRQRMKPRKSCKKCKVKGIFCDKEHPLFGRPSCCPHYEE